MNLEQLDLLLGEISRERGVDDFVVVGSLRVLGLTRGRPVPPEMLISNEVDAYVEQDPELGFEFHKRWGQGSDFERVHGYYFDPVSPKLPTLPSGWQERVIPMTLPSGVSVKFLDPNDAAVSKYARGEAKDKAWIREGLRQSILSLATIEYRFRETPFLDREEHERAKSALEEDRKWLDAVNKTGRPGELAAPARSSCGTPVNSDTCISPMKKSFAQRIAAMNAIYKLPANDRPLVPTDVVDRLVKFKATLLDEVHEIDEIVALSKNGGTAIDIAVAVADLLGDIMVYCRSEALKYGLPRRLPQARARTPERGSRFQDSGSSRCSCYGWSCFGRRNPRLRCPCN